MYGMKTPHTAQINLTLFRSDLVPCTSIHIRDLVQSPISGLPAPCQHVLCLSDHILLRICHLPVCPLTPTESASHNYSSSKHCTLFKLLRSSCHLIHWAPKTELPVLLAVPGLLLPYPTSDVLSWKLPLLGLPGSEHCRKRDAPEHTWFTDIHAGPLPLIQSETFPQTGLI